MRITYITAGAGGMYCGSCLRDNALATALSGRGHDVTLLPLYTPTRTDEPNVSESRVFFGGISVFLEQYISLFRKTPWLLDRLWESPRLLRAVASRAVETKPAQLGALTVSVLEGAHGHQRKELDKLVSWLKDQPRPDVLDISNSMLIAIAGPLKEALGCPINCTLQGEDIFMEGLLEPFRSRSKELIRSHLQHVDSFVAVSDYYAGHMAQYLGIPGAKMHVVPLGVSPDTFTPASDRASAPFTLGYLGRIAPEKGVHLLVDAYRNLRERGALAGCRIEVAGYLGGEHLSYWQSIEREVKAWGLDGEIQYRGELDLGEKVRFLQSLDLFVVPATYDDPKGMSLIEAMACGVPVVAARRGSYTELLERTGGGVLVAPDDFPALEETMRALVDDRERVVDLGQRARAGVCCRYTTDEMTTAALDVYHRLTT
ncbi:MAG: glycosyltransferase family 4 protein [Vicinamibacterales bacterium]|nr:glycosyltransferase family 4 protein [Vicinamibacterales bacterium]